MPVELDLVGDPDRYPAYARRVRAELRRPALVGRVRVHGRVSSDRLAALYAAAGAMVLASSHEGYGTVLAEAVAWGSRSSPPGWEPCRRLFATA